MFFKCSSTVNGFAMGFAVRSPWTAFLQALRGWSRRGVPTTVVAETTTTESSPLDVSQDAAQESEGRVLRETVESLSPEERLICVWTAVGFSKRQIAKASGRSIDHVETVLKRASHRIKGRLQMPASDEKP